MNRRGLLRKRVCIGIASVLATLFTSAGLQAQNHTTISGVIRDSVTKAPLSFVNVQFAGTASGMYSQDDGTFKLSNSRGKTTVEFSSVGYKTKKISVPEGRSVYQVVLLAPDNKVLKEVVVRPRKQKYSKKHNPAVELIEKVIANKDKNTVFAKDYFDCRENEFVLFGLNDFKADQNPFKKFKFLPKYVTRSTLGDANVLPFSIRERVGEYYYRRQPKEEKRLTEGYGRAGIDKAIKLEGLDVVINEIFKNVSIYDNTITLLFQNFISPLSSSEAVNFYRWYIRDTTNTDGKSYINLDFVPFNTRDMGFTGSLKITNDSSYAVKEVVMKVPVLSNINLVDRMLVRQEFEEVSPSVWAPVFKQMSIDGSLYSALKIHVDKMQNYSRFSFQAPPDSIFSTDREELFAGNYDKRSPEFWKENRLPDQQTDYNRIDEMIKEIIRSNFLVQTAVAVGTMVGRGGYFPTNGDDNKNAVDLGSLVNAYSYNEIEGNRLRLTARTNAHFNKHLFFYTYGAYGTADERFKYYGEATWAFNTKQLRKEEFPRDNLTFSYKNDIEDLGQEFMMSKRDDAFMSFSRSSTDKSVFTNKFNLLWEKEKRDGLSFNLSSTVFTETPVGSLSFKTYDTSGNPVFHNSIKSTEIFTQIRYANNEKFFEFQRQRYQVPTPGYTVTLANTAGVKNVFGSQYNYDKLSLFLEYRLWVPPYGKFLINLQAEKLWGKVPFTLLLTPSVNTSYVVEDNNFYMLEPLEFIHDEQAVWNVEYRMGGLILNRIPLINRLKLREIIGFRGLCGDLSNDNNPLYNRQLFAFPENADIADKKPYMEYTIGLENIFKVLRLDYVRRLNYNDYPGVSKNGIRFTLIFSF